MKMIPAIDVVTTKRVLIRRRIGRGETPQRQIMYHALVKAKINDPKTIHKYNPKSEKQVKKGDIQRRIVGSMDYAKESFVFIYEHQLDIEKRRANSLYRNNIGFNRPDARRADRLLNKMHRGTMNSDDHAEMQRMMYKYSQQIADLMNGTRRKFTRFENAVLSKKKLSGAELERFMKKRGRINKNQTEINKERWKKINGKTWNPGEHSRSRRPHLTPTDIQNIVERNDQFAKESIISLNEAESDPNRKEQLSVFSGGGESGVDKADFDKIHVILGNIRNRSFTSVDVDNAKDIIKKYGAKMAAIINTGREFRTPSVFDRLKNRVKQVVNIVKKGKAIAGKIGSLITRRK